MMNGSALQRISEDIPRISNPLGLAAMGIATLGVGAALTRLRPSDREGRSQRFARMIEVRLRSTLEKQVRRGEYGNVNSAPWDVDRCEVQVNEGFGKPTVVCFTVVMTVGGEELAEDLRAHAAQGLLAAAVEAAWRNPEIAPIVIEGKLQCGDEDIVDMRALGYSSLQVRPEELFERLGAPAFDSGWRPV